MYLRAAKEDAEESSIATDGMASSVSELRDSIKSLTGNKVDIMTDSDTFKSTYEILKELSEVWDDLTDVSQANILEMVGGKRNSNVVAALLENFDIAEQALATSSDSAGSALEENEKYLDSIQGKLDTMSASFETLSSDLISSDFVKWAVDSGATILDILDNITNSLGSLGTILLGGALYKGFKSFA